jgi:hypothetical protein
MKINEQIDASSSKELCLCDKNNINAEEFND